MRSINRLTAKSVLALQEPGLHADGNGLYLRIDQTISKRWVYIYTWAGKRREMGLGSAAPHGVGLKEARETATVAREQVRAGIDPILARRAAERAELTLGELAEEVVRDKFGVTFRYPPGVTSGFKQIATTDAEGRRPHRTALQWWSSLTQHCRPIWHLPAADIATEDVQRVLNPIWTTIEETARRLRSRIEYILDVAKVKGLRTGENPARWKGHLKLLMPVQSGERGHFAALPYEQIPQFMTDLRERAATSARALEFLILGANRTEEVLLARWPEIQGDMWVIPGERMKGGKEHRVWLMPRHLEILDEMRLLRRAPDDLIFPGDQRIEPLSNNAMLNLLERMGVDVTVHGFRSTFHDWASDVTDHAEEVIEHSLAHKVGDAVVRAYRRRSAMEKRRLLMADWSAYCARSPDNVVALFKG